MFKVERRHMLLDCNLHLMLSIYTPPLYTLYKEHNLKSRTDEVVRVRVPYASGSGQITTLACCEPIRQNRAGALRY